MFGIAAALLGSPDETHQAGVSPDRMEARVADGRREAEEFPFHETREERDAAGLDGNIRPPSPGVR